HIDTDVRDDFLISYNEDDVDRIAEHIILLRKLPQPLLYLCGLTMYCQHPELSHVIKDPEGQVIAIDDFLKLPHWNRTLVSKGVPITDNERPPVRTTNLLPVGYVIPEKNAHYYNLEVTDTFRVSNSLTASNSEDTIFVAPIHHTIPKPLNETVGPKGKGIEVSVVNLSNHTQETTSPLVVKTLNEQIIQDDHQVKDTHISDAHSFHSIHEEDNDEDADNHRYVPA
ncbi:hypothetical protein Tco_0731766, partial [Tanacetum coccineum]